MFGPSPVRAPISAYRLRSRLPARETGRTPGYSSQIAHRPGTPVGWARPSSVTPARARGNWNSRLTIDCSLFIAAKAWKRYQFRQQLKHPRVSVEELNQMIAAGHRPLVVDVRMASSHAESRIAGALWIDSMAVERGAPELPASDEVIVYCACQNEATAVQIARALQKHGFSRVRALQGGIDAWASAGYPVEGRDPPGNGQHPAT
jgi:rhodanese-related sulfurtransferase